MNVERELQELREQLAQVEEWKKRHEEIQSELAKVWVAGPEGEDEKEGEVLPEPDLKEKIEQPEQSEEFNEKAVEA